MITIWNIRSYTGTPISKICTWHKLLPSFLRRWKISWTVLIHRKLWHVPLVTNGVEILHTNDFESTVHVLSSNDINALCHSFPYIEQLSIHLLSVTDLPQLLNRMKMTLTDLIITQPYNINNEQFITREWIERNTELRKFHYTCAYEIFISLWLWYLCYRNISHIYIIL